LSLFVRSRGFRIFLLTVIALWFGVVVPVHPRGMIRLGGGGEARSCCHREGKRPAKDSKPDPSQCAICQFVATLDLPAAIGFALPPMGFVEAVELPARREAPWREWEVLTLERAPPMA
jgi:hypothetical protein